MPILLTGQESDEQLRLLAGGKARNLCDLTAAGFPVPRWAILGTEAFEKACAAAGVSISQAPLSLAERLAEAAFAESALCELTMPAEIRDAIAAAVDYVGAETVAVRSSGRQEDGDRDSFAGLFDTFLNVAGLDATEDAVRRCWASAFSQRATQYRHVRGLDFGDVALAVVIQRSLTPRSSGVMFTVDPITGSPDRLVINGVLGLGEGLVSGAVDSDSVSIDKDTGRILDEMVSAKSEMMVGAAGGGVATVGVPVERRQETSVDPALRATLLDLGIRLEQHFGSPQDVEWACDDTSTWILQSRPVTTLDREFDLTAEYFGESTEEVRIWDNSNIIESFAGVTSPLTFTTARKLYGDVYRAYARSLKVPPAQLEQMESWLPVMLGQFHGHVYYNLLHWYRMVGIAPGYPLNRRVLEVALGVSEPLDRKTATQLRPFIFANPVEKAVSRARTTIAYLRSIRSVDAMIDDFDDTFVDFIDRHGLMDVSAMDGPSAYRMFRQIYDEVADLWGPMMVLDAMLLTMVGSLAVLTKTFLRGAPEWVQFAVVNPEPDVISVEPARELADIAAFVREHPELDEFIASAEPSVAYAHLAERADDADSPLWQELHSKIEKYIDRFGYRCLDELKLETPDLRQDPAGIFHLLRMDTAGQREHTGSSVQEYLDAHLRGRRRRVFDALRRKVQRAATHREHLRFCRTQGFGILKSLVGVMGRELEQRGTIHDRSDVFQLRIDELFDLYEDAMTTAAAQSAIRRRKLLQDSYSRFAAPARFTTTGSDYSERELARAGWRPAEESTHAPAGTVLTGTPSSPGVVTGRAVVVEKPQDFSSGILVAYRTDPGWASALPFASALLIERASPLTHVAIIARELGVPTVVQIDGLTDAVRTGMTVSVDGATGRVVLVEEPGS
ncbi:phosphoenolpyruvate synthase [Mycolicibacterium sp. ELW1]|uniref:phosphoenolpyruvate synthase n=1 Tax=Mycobacteriaceae TaxID=1762 RepID=UPI002570D767|nr:phosphoenolpyruvate synthase [Mycobacterium sp. ELW1]